MTVRKRGWGASLGLAASLAGLLALPAGCPTKQNPEIHRLCCHGGICSPPDGSALPVDGSPGRCEIPDAEADGDALEPDAADGDALEPDAADGDALEPDAADGDALEPDAADASAN